MIIKIKTDTGYLTAIDILALEEQKLEESEEFNLTLQKTEQTKNKYTAIITGL